MPGDVLSVAKHRYEVNYSPTSDAPPPAEAEPNPMSMSLLEKAGLSQRMSRDSSFLSNSSREERRNPPQRHTLDAEPKRKDDDDDDLDDDKLVWLDK